MLLLSPKSSVPGGVCGWSFERLFMNECDVVFPLSSTMEVGLPIVITLCIDRAQCYISHTVAYNFVLQFLHFLIVK